MNIEFEIQLYDKANEFLKEKILNLASIDVPDATENEIFLAEAVAFRIYRSYERFIRAAFLHSCATAETLSGKSIVSKLRCESWSAAEDILKAGNRFLDCGKPETTKKLADLIFENGFPISDVIAPVHSTLVDLQRVRNFIAHDSREAEDGFSKVVANYIARGSTQPESAGELLLSRRRKRESQAINKIFERVSVLSTIYSDL